MKIFKKIKNNRGFTLIETMVAIFILSLALVALLTLMANSLFISRYNRNEITANYLLQEVIDTVKNDKSSNMLKALKNPSDPTDYWGDFVNRYLEKCEDKYGCEIDAKSGEINKCDSEDCGYLSYDETANNANGTYYYYNDADKNSSYFKRTIKITKNPITDIPELRIMVTISWRNGSQDMPSESLTTSLLPWEK